MKVLNFEAPEWGVNLTFRVDETPKQAKLTGPNGCGKTTLLQTIRREHAAGPALGVYSSAEVKAVEKLHAYGGLLEPFTQTDCLLPGKFALTSPMDLRDFIWLHWGTPVESLDFYAGELVQKTIEPEKAVEILRRRKSTDIFDKAIPAITELTADDLVWASEVGGIEAVKGQVISALRTRSTQYELIAKKVKDTRDVLNIKIRAAEPSIRPEFDHHMKMIGCAEPPFKSLTELERPAHTYSQGELTHLRQQLLAAAAFKKDGTVTVLLDDQDNLGLDESKVVLWPDNVRLLTVGPGYSRHLEVLK